MVATRWKGCEGGYSQGSGSAMNNPFRIIGIYKKADAVLDVLDDGRKDWDEGTRTSYRTQVWWERLLVASRGLALSLPLPAALREELVMKNWRTSLAGIAAIFAVLVKVIQTGSVDWGTDAPAVMAGVGLIVAKDSNVTGGTIRQ